MTSNRSITVAAALLLVTMFTGSVFALRQVQTLRGKESTLEEVLYLPSGKMLKRMSLGYSGLLANIYWTRAVQYFGAKHGQRSARYDLLAPLLNITTDLDPQLIVAYETGSIFLAQRLPEGAGQPDQAAALIEKGIRENPTQWRLYFSLGFIHYLDRKDYKAAAEAFRRGSEVPGALPWMKVMAARMAERGDDPATAFELWKAVYENNKDATIRDTALRHIVSLQADADMVELAHRVEAYRQRTGSVPSDWKDLIHAGLLRRIPRDPTGAPYKLMPDGAIGVEDPSKLPFLGEHAAKKDKK
jgi:tetratricopeptide (TPR) repeat protein